MRKFARCFLFQLAAALADHFESKWKEPPYSLLPLLEDTVQKTLAEVLVIREDILTRTKSIRSEDGEVTICPEQGIKQEEKLTEIRMSGRTHGTWRAFSNMK